MNHDVGKGCPHCALALALFALKVIVDIPKSDPHLGATIALRQIKEKYGFTPEKI